MLTGARSPPGRGGLHCHRARRVEGEVTFTSVALTKVTEPAGMVVPPNVTVVAPETKPLPVRVTTVPPAVGPASV